jgi:hypothetical protein
MGRKPCLCRAILAATAAAIVLPIAISVLLAVAALLAAMGDAAGGGVARYIALACGVAWVIDLVCLVILQGLHALGQAHRGDEDPLSEKDQPEA